ncbi:MAG: divalent-cation tolerance protein CutA [Sphingobium sp.]
MSDIDIVYSVFPDAESAARVARQCVHDGLTACVNILPTSTSIYEWEGEVTEASEVPALFKTTTARVDALIEQIRTMHPYEVPAILSWPVVRAPHDFAKWVHQVTRR